MREIKIMFKAIPTIVIFLCLLYVTLLRVTMETVPVQLGYALGIALLGGLVMLCVRNYSIKIVRMDILISVYVLYRLVMYYVDSGFGIGIGTQAILYMFGVYIAGRIAFQDERRGMYIFSMLFMLCGIYEAALGLGQLYGNTPSGHGMYRVTGTFFNPGPYSCYPAMVAAYAGIYIYKNYTAFIDIYRQNGWRSAAGFYNG